MFPRRLGFGARATAGPGAAAGPADSKKRRIERLTDQVAAGAGASGITDAERAADRRRAAGGSVDDSPLDEEVVQMVVEHNEERQRPELVIVKPVVVEEVITFTDEQEALLKKVGDVYTTVWKDTGHYAGIQEWRQRPHLVDVEDVDPGYGAPKVSRSVVMCGGTWKHKTHFPTQHYVLSPLDMDCLKLRLLDQYKSKGSTDVMVVSPGGVIPLGRDGVVTLVSGYQANLHVVCVRHEVEYFVRQLAYLRARGESILAWADLPTDADSVYAFISMYGHMILSGLDEVVLSTLLNTDPTISPHRQHQVVYNMMLSDPVYMLPELVHTNEDLSLYLNGQTVYEPRLVYTPTDTTDTRELGTVEIGGIVYNYRRTNGYAVPNDQSTAAEFSSLGGDMDEFRRVGNAPDGRKIHPYYATNAKLQANDSTRDGNSDIGGHPVRLPSQTIFDPSFTNLVLTSIVMEQTRDSGQELVLPLLGYEVVRAPHGIHIYVIYPRDYVDIETIYKDITVPLPTYDTQLTELGHVMRILTVLNQSLRINATSILNLMLSPSNRLILHDLSRGVYYRTQEHESDDMHAPLVVGNYRPVSYGITYTTYRDGIAALVGLRPYYPDTVDMLATLEVDITTPYHTSLYEEARGLTPDVLIDVLGLQ